jgi:UDP-glucose 4-epimerase
MKICIIGASSYIGGWIVESLKNTEHDISVVYRNEPICDYNWKSGLSKIIVGDITDLNVINAIIEIEPEIIVYLVSLNHIQSENNIFKTLNINVSPMVYLANELSKLKTFNKFIYFSTLQVIGKISNGQIIDESTMPKPLNNYGLTHFFCEEALAMLNRSNKLNHTIIRLANSYGPAKYNSCDTLWLVINDFCSSALKNNIIQLKSDGSPQRDFIYLNDVARAVNFIIKFGNEVPPIVNVSSEITMTMLELAHLTKKVCKNYGLEVRVLLPNGNESYDCETHLQIERYVIKSWLYKVGFEIKTNLEEGILYTIENLKKHNN